MTARRVVPHPSLRLLITALAVLGGAAFIAANSSAVPDVWRTATRAQPVWLAAALLTTIAASVNVAALHVAARRALSMRSTLRQLLAPALTAQFLNLIVTSGGLAGLAALQAEGRHHQRDPATVTGAFLVVAVAGQLAVVGVLPVAFILLATSGHLTFADAAAGLVFAAYTAAITTLITVALRSPINLRRIYALPRRTAARLRRRPPPPEDHTAADALYQAISQLRRSPARAALIVAHALIVDIAGIVLLWCVLRALRLPVGFDVAIVAYAVSLMFSIIGFLPGGLGFVEISLAAVLVAYRTPTPAAAAAVGLYRLFELWLPVLAGAAVARSVLRRATTIDSAQPTSH